MEHISNQLQEIQKSGLVNKEWRQPVISSEENLALAISSPNLLQRRLEDLKEVLRLVMVKIGLRPHNWPTDADKGVLIQHIEEHFGKHSPEEIKLAFDMAINGRIGEGDDFANCYENFSCAFFSKIMNAYRKWAATEVKYLPKENTLTPVPEGIADWTEVYDRFLSMDLEALGAQPIPAEIFDWLVYIGKIKLSKEEKNEKFKEAVLIKRKWIFEEITHKSTPERQKYLKEFNRQIAEDDFMADTIAEVKKVAKKVFIHERMKKEKQAVCPNF